MEVRGQQVETNDVRMSSGGGGRRGGDGNHNGNSTAFLASYNNNNNNTQTLDHHHHRGGSHNNNGGGSKGNPVVVRYRECLRNHAASVGGNVFDGCGEFMPGGEEGSLEALKCAACDCHRNFHRKEVDGETAAASPTATVFSPGSRRGGGHLVHALQLPPALPSPMVHHGHHHPHHHIHGSHHRYLHHSASPPAAVQPMNVAFGGSGGGGGSAATGGTESSSEDLNAFPSSEVATGMHMVTPPQPPYGMSKKRFRTKFTPEQKERMMEFAEKVGWRINKQDEEAVERFCSEVGVRRQVFKVWMHNNKNVKKTPSPTTTNMMNMHHHHLHHHPSSEIGGGQPEDDHHHQEGML